MNLVDFLPLVNLMSVIGLAVGGAWFFRTGMSRTASEVQERVINAMNAEIATLKSKIEMLEKENVRHALILSLVRQALTKRGLLVTVDGDMVTISDGHAVQATHIQES